MKWNRRSGLSFSLAALITLAIAGSAVAAGTAAPTAVRVQAKPML